jgi:hypothetical protein
MSAMPHIGLLPMLEAAHALRLAGALPSPKGISMHRLTAAGGMRPWLRLTLGEDGARTLEDGLKGGWCLGALLGDNVGRRLEPSVTFDPAEMWALLLVDTLCEEATTTRWSAWIRIKDHLPRSESERLLPEFIEHEMDSGWRSRHVLDILEPTLDHIAAQFGMAPRKEASGLSMWHERAADGTVCEMAPREYYLHGHGVKNPERALVRLDDGSGIWLHENDRPCWPGRFVSRIGTRLRLTWRGATAGHGGCLARVQDLDLINALARMDERIKAEAETNRIIAEHNALRAIDSTGRIIEAGQRVELLTECLEAPRLAVGEVIEICGDMAVVDFRRRGARRVPCYGHAVAVLEDALAG